MLSDVRKQLVVLAAAGGLLVGSCSSNGGSNGLPSPPVSIPSIPIPSIPIPSISIPSIPIPSIPGLPTPLSGAQARVTQLDFRFDPPALAMSTKQGLRITNNGSVVHNFSIQGTQVDVDVQPDEFTNTEAIGGTVQPGTYVFFCKFHRSRGMIGAIVILPG
jgi:plastocyanin